MRQNDFRKPVEYIIDQELKKRNLRGKINVNSNDNEYKGGLPEYPVKLIRNSDKKVEKVIYAEGTKLQWSEELIRNTEGKIYRVKTIYPDKTEKIIQLFKDIDSKVETIDYI